MTYATQQNMIDRFGQEELTQLTDRTRSGGIDAAVVDRALADADAVINGYVSAKYTLPLSPVPAGLERIACDIARYGLYDDRATEQVKQRYDAAITFLKDVAKGTATLGPDAANQAPSITGGPQHSAPERIFTHDTLEDF